ncbi:hypothetical protein D3C71_338750 [compost metagenome]
MLNENMLISASKALRGITTAQAAVDEAKRLVEEAKAGVETARNGLSEAKATYDAVIAEIAGTGLSASKARKAVEDMLRIFADVGIIDAPADEPASAEPKAPRRKKAEAAPASVEVTEEPAASVEPVTKVTEPVAAPEPAAVIEEEAAVEPEAPAPVETAAAVDVPVEASADDQAAAAEVTEVSEIDNGEAIGEIYALIESSTESEDISVSETLITLLNAADWYSREHRKEALTLDLYREVLSIDFVNQAAASDGLDREMKGALESVGKLDAAETIFEWFLYALDKLENGSKHISYAEHVAQNSAAASEPVAEVAEVEEVAVVEAAEALEVAAAEEVDEEIEAESTDYIPDPEAAEDLSDDVSDDVTLAADDGLVGVEVDDIEEINFLEQPAESEKPEAPAATEASETVAAPAAEGAAPRGFKRPTFLNKKG